MYHYIICLGKHVVLDTTNQKQYFDFEESVWKDGCDFVNVDNISDSSIHALFWMKMIASIKNFWEKQDDNCAKETKLVLMANVIFLKGDDWRKFYMAKPKLYVLLGSENTGKTTTLNLLIDMLQITSDVYNVEKIWSGIKNQDRRWLPRRLCNVLCWCLYR